MSLVIQDGLVIQQVNQLNNIEEESKKMSLDMDD